MTIELFIKKFQEGVEHYGPKILTALLVFAVGYLLIRITIAIARKGLERSKIDKTMHTFMLSIAKIALLVVLSIICMGVMDIPITPLITALGAVGLAVSLAVKDSLSNLMGGSLVLIAKPFIVGDFCDIDGLTGTVSEIGLIYTSLNTIDNKRIYIPNGQVANTKIINFSSEDKRRLDLELHISYQDDFELAQRLVMEEVKNHPLAMQDPPPLVRMLQHGNHAIILTCRVWVDPANYWPLNFDLLENIKRQFDANHINIPYNQLDVHVIEQPVKQ